MLGLSVKPLQEALPFTVQKPRGKSSRFGLSQFDKAGGGAFDFALGGGGVLLCELFCYPTEKIKHLVNSIVDQFNAWLWRKRIGKGWFPIVGVVRCKNGDCENRQGYLFHGSHCGTEL